MSGWIKWEKALESDPRVLRMARELKRTCNAGELHPVTLVCGGLIRMWSYADSHIRDDDTLDLGAAELDEVIGIPNFCSLLPDDWLRQVDEHQVELPDFQSHNGVEARKKALTLKRVTRHRDKVKRSGVTEALPDQTRLDQTIVDRSTEFHGKPTKPKASKKAPKDFRPDLEFAALVAPDLDGAAEAARFLDYEFKTAKTDWPAAWRNWVRKALADGQYSRRGGKGGDPYAGSI